jgi:predicted dehydrogenase
MERLKAAIIGCGLIATRKYIPILQKLHSQVELVGICDLNEAALAAAASHFKIQTTYRHIPDLVAEQKPDLMIVCTPPRTHLDVVLQAFQSGAHVLVEKPMAMSTVECDQMIEASLRHNKKLGVMHNQLFNPAFEQARQIVSSGAVGEFLGMRISLVTCRNDFAANPDHWVHRLPGGVVGETGPHAVYLSLTFLDQVHDIDVRVIKNVPEYHWSKAEDYRFILAANNGLSSVSLSYASHQTAADIDIICVDEILKVDLQTRLMLKQHRLGLSTRALSQSLLSTIWQLSRGSLVNAVKYRAGRTWDGHYLGVRRFIDHLLNDAFYPATGTDGRRVIRVEEMLVKKVEEAYTLGGNS